MRPLANRSTQLALAVALLVATGCRDVQKDPQYCETCGMDASVVAPAQSQSAESAGSESSSAGTTGTTTVVGAAGIPGSASMASAAISGVGGRGLAAGSGGSSTSGAILDAGMDSGADAAADGGKDASAPMQPDSSIKPDAAPLDAGQPNTTPPSACGGPCPSDKPVCDEGKRICVECTPNDKHACTGENPVCDGNTCVPCSTADPGVCRGQTPVCEPQSLTCVECSAARPDTCTGDKRVCDTTKNTCGECSPARLDTCVGDKRVCDTDSNTCVECSAAQPTSCDALGKHCLVGMKKCVQCLEPTQCTDPANSSCDLNQHTCQPCNDNQACAHIAGMLACDTSAHRCVECTKASERDRCPSGSMCDEATHKCQAPSGPMRQLCETCTLDSDCGSAAVCQAYPGSTQHFCFPRPQNNSCGMPAYSQLRMVPFDSGYISYCQPAASCNALQDTGAHKRCTHKSGEQDDACGDRTLKDGVCNAAMSCSYRCVMPQDCPSGSSCRDGVCS